MMRGEGLNGTARGAVMTDGDGGDGGEHRVGPAPVVERAEEGFERGLELVRLVVVVPVTVLVLAATGAFVYGTYVFLSSVRAVVEEPLPVGHRIGLFLAVVDLFLVGATLLIVAFGLYELFVSRVDPGGAPRLPGWLEIRDLNDLKARVVSMVVLVASVSFVETAAAAADGRLVLELGGGVAVVIVALAVYLRLGGSGHGEQ
jgi:uncharacterized protein (TIGR00645 family)